MPTSTATTIHTRVETATYLTDVILGTIGDLLAALGINAMTMYRDWAQHEAAIKQWIQEESLAMVILECVQPSGKVAPVIEFPVTYTSVGLGTGSFASQRAQLARYRAKLAGVPSGTTYRLLCTYRKTSTAMPGWTPGTRASTEGLRATNFGLLGSAPHASAAMRVLT